MLRFKLEHRQMNGPFFYIQLHACTLGSLFSLEKCDPSHVKTLEYI